MPQAKIKIFPKNLSNYFKGKGVDPKILEHRTAYTAIDAANTLKRKMEEIVKSLLVKADDYYYVVCLPANQNLDFKKIKTEIEKIVGKKIRTILIPDEKVMAKILKFKNEGLTAFGGLYKLPVLVEKKLASLKKLVFPAGTFRHSVEMGMKDFSRLENVLLANFGINKKVKIINMPPSSSKMRKGATKKMAKKKAVKKVAKRKAVKKTAKKAVKKTAKRKAKKSKK